MAFKKILKSIPASEEVSYDGEILENGIVQVRKCTIKKDAEGNVLSKSYHRHCIEPGQDYSNEPAEVQAECQREHTVEKVNARAAFILEQQENL
tara:strand:+ start:281 stop:562 length:282 start_codon:yes stop_codon:yes gene_type:complete